MRKLTLDDISDLRAYERERVEFRARVIAMKKRRRVGLGDLLTITFEHTDTMRFQVQEMARAERILSDAAIQTELDIYNDLIPGGDELVGTLFIEIDDPAGLREWLPRLVGIQRAIVVRLPDGTEARGEPLDEERLTRDDVTAAVHYLRFRFPPGAAAAFRAGPTAIVVDHPEYPAEVVLADEHRAELAGDLDASA
jgi:hypothetical protein